MEQAPDGLWSRGAVRRPRICVHACTARRRRKEAGLCREFVIRVRLVSKEGVEFRQGDFETLASRSSSRQPAHPHGRDTRMTTATTDTAPRVPEAIHRRRWAILGTLILALLVV